MTTTYAAVQYNGASLMVHQPKWGSPAGKRACLVAHGHGGAYYQIAQGASWGTHCTQWADDGMVVIGMDLGPASFGDPDALATVSNAYDYAMSIGCLGPRVWLAGWSMGGLTMLRWIRENLGKTAAAYLFSPLTNMQWAYTTGGYTAEMDAAYADDGTYAALGAPYSPILVPEVYRGVPIQIAHPTNDGTIPVQHTLDFVAAVNNPSVGIRTPQLTTGGHQPQISTTPYETSEWLRTHGQAAA